MSVSLVLFFLSVFDSLLVYFACVRDRLCVCDDVCSGVLCSTSPPGENQVDSLPPVQHTGSHRASWGLAGVSAYR